MPDLAVGILSCMIVSQLLSKLAPFIISLLSSLFSSVFRDAIVRKGIRSSLLVFIMVGMWTDRSDARDFFAGS